MVRSARGVSALRQLALQILCQVDVEGAFADHRIAATVAGQGLSPQARALLRELTYGVLRWRNRLDWLLAHCSRRPLATLTPEIRNLLRLGAYELCFMAQIPAYAAVWENVELAKQVGHAGIVAFVNAVLRALERQRNSLALPDRADDLVTYLTITQSHPRWLAERWLQRYGPERTEAMCRANNSPPPLTVRVNRLRARREQLIESLLAEGCQVEPCHFAPDGVLIQRHPELDGLQCYADGWFYVQDEAAMLCGYLLSPEPGERLLDACAAPGGKVTHLAELMGDQGEIVALDHSEQRLRLVEENCRRLGLRSIHPLVGNAMRMGFDRVFDRILVDVPCSGLGVVRRHPDAKWRKGPELIAAMARQQVAILDHVSHLLKPGGILVYATCSTEPEENEDVMGSFLRQHPDYRLDPVAAYLPASARLFVHGDGYAQTWPGPEGLDGFFGARFRRVANEVSSFGFRVSSANAPQPAIRNSQRLT